MKIFPTVVTLATALLMLTFSASAETLKAQNSKTIENLRAAFHGESNANRRYLAFAEKAEQEGYGEVASLFRAAAQAEQIHADNHAAVLKRMGIVAPPTIDSVKIQSTKENLKAAIEGESYERDTMYPTFLKQARAENNREAIRSFNYAKTAETEHARLYKDALGSLPNLRGKGRTYYVCTVCGYTTAKVEFASCPSCFEAKDKYKSVS